MTLKREDILAAAQRLVSIHGFHGTSMAMIAAEANCGAGTIYHYFPSKDDLMRALFVQGKQEYVQKMMEGTSANQPIRDTFFVIWSNMIRYAIESADRMAFLQQFHSSPYFDQTCLNFLNEALLPIVKPFERAMVEGLIKRLPLPVLESLTIDVAGTLARRHLQGEIVLDEDLIRQTAEMCWAAICTETNTKMLPKEE